ncbi:MAG: helix-turn-helix transcriptional regulator, partial [Candidatus Firestonebacteria bacterium]
WTIKDLAQIVAMSPDYFAHASSSIYGISPMKFVTKLRMERAKELLFTEEYKLETISEMVGYKDPFAFSTAFKRHEGLSPKSYKLKNR